MSCLVYLFSDLLHSLVVTVVIFFLLPDILSDLKNFSLSAKETPDSDLADLLDFPADFVTEINPRPRFAAVFRFVERGRFDNWIF